MDSSRFGPARQGRSRRSSRASGFRTARPLRTCRGCESTGFATAIRRGASCSTWTAPSARQSAPSCPTSRCPVPGNSGHRPGCKRSSSRSVRRWLSFEGELHVERFRVILNGPGGLPKGVPGLRFSSWPPRCRRVWKCRLEPIMRRRGKRNPGRFGDARS